VSGVTDDNRAHARQAASYVPIREAKVLVVGCNTGNDCREFIELGAPEVWGVDVVEEIGRDFRHPAVRYLRTPVEAMDLPDGKFDLVFTYATMEHVRDIARAFAEMARVTRPGGWIYSVAMPLWNSPWGHHKPELFPRHPWIHLLHDRDEILALCRRENIVAPDGVAIEHHVEYMLSPEFFNKAPAAAYERACADLAGFEVLRNGFGRLPGSLLDAQMQARLASRGFTRAEALAVSHVFIGQKAGRAGGRLWRTTARLRSLASRILFLLQRR